MHIRPLVRADIPRVAELFSECFGEEPPWLYLWPHQDRYPDDVRRDHLLSTRRLAVQQGGQYYVAETEPGCACRGCAAGRDAGRKIVGYSLAFRRGNDAAARRWRKQGWASRLEEYLLGWEGWYEKTVLHLRRANDDEAWKRWGERERYEYEKLREYWFVLGLGVDPRCQRRGIGRMLVQHGLDIAAEEQVPVCLEASEMGGGLYTKIGFKVIQRPAVVEGVEPLPKGVAMLWEPPALQGTWLEEGQDGKVKLKTPP